MSGAEGRRPAEDSLVRIMAKMAVLADTVSREKEEWVHGGYVHET